jgi:hypothetical protein
LRNGVDVEVWNVGERGVDHVRDLAGALVVNDDRAQVFVFLVLDHLSGLGGPLHVQHKQALAITPLELAAPARRRRRLTVGLGQHRLVLVVQVEVHRGMARASMSDPFRGGRRGR